MRFSFETVHSIISPADASKMTGRYETTAEVKGKAHITLICISLK